MKLVSFRIAILGGALLVALAALPAPSHAQTSNGPWIQTSDCQPQRARGGLFRKPELPGTMGTDRRYHQPMECRWERIVRRCPRLFRSMRDCSERRERSGYSPNRPRD